MDIKRAEPRYVKATAVFHFDGNNVCCEQCPCMETYARRQCRLTGEYIVNPKVVGYDCPLGFECEEITVIEDMTDMEEEYGIIHEACEQDSERSESTEKPVK